MPFNFKELKPKNKVELYKQIIKKEAKINDKKLKELVEEKKHNLKGLISEEGALFIIAKELGVELDSKKALEEQKAQEAFNDSLDPFGEPEVATPPKETKKPPKKPTKPKVIEQKEEIAPTEVQFPIIHIKTNDKNLALLEPEEQQRILSEINKLKFAIQSALEPTDYFQKLPTRSGCHKIQTIFNISTEIIEEKFWKEDDQWIAKYKVRAISLNNRYSEAIGICEQNEKARRRTLHDTLATAQTRATNRAILDLVGFGTVSAEEVNDTYDKNIDDAFG